jgi:hypothetical protein
LKITKYRGFNLSSAQKVQHARKVNEQKARHAKAVQEATLLYETEKEKEKGMSSTDIAMDFLNTTGEWVSPSTIRNMVLQGRAGEEPKRRGPEGKINDEQFEALSVAFVLHRS